MKPPHPAEAHPKQSAASDPRWASVLARDPAADPHFVYAVTSTGVYCRASSTARLPKPSNVVFFNTAEEAEAAGYRPSRRHAADQSSNAAHYAERVALACRRIESADSPPSLASLAGAVGLSPYHFQRQFKAITGLTPKGYAHAHRANKMRAQLASNPSITAAMYEAGFNSNGRFYATSKQVLGMSPSDYRAGGAHHTLQFAVGQCTLGAILVAESEQGVCAITLGDDPQALVRELQDKFPKAQLIGDDIHFAQRVAQIVGFIEHPALGLHLPLDIRGTAFQQRVWQALRQIPPGSTASYADIAQRIGQPSAVRAVAGACAANTLAVAIPCHRVIRSDGGISGYRWGVERKRALLAREAPGHEAD